MNRTELARLLDPPLLKPEATEEDIIAQVEVVRCASGGSARRLPPTILSPSE